MTIRKKMTLGFTAFLLALVLGGVALNAAYLLRFYIAQNRPVFTATADRIALQYATDPQGVSDLIDGVDRLDGIACTLVDPDLTVVASSFPLKTPAMRKLAAEIAQIIRNNGTVLSTRAIYRVVDRADQASKLVYLRRLDDGSYLVLTRAIKGIRESVAIANRFYAVSGLVLLVAGGIFIFFYAKRTTKPIVAMSEAAEGIARLDFSRRVGTDAQDEIGTLGRSIDRISERLSGSLEALQEDVERRKQLVRNISHDLKTPIGVIKGYAEGLRFGVADDDEKRARYCEVIAVECDRMDDMVRELLDLSMLENGGREADRTRFDLAELARRVADRFESSAKEKGAVLEADGPAPVPVDADETLVERAVVNYVTNAIHHVDGERRLIRVTAAARPGGGARLTVYNTGSPIPPEELGRVWDLFHKADRARSRAYGGHGLGLSIVKRVADLHGGTVGVENVDGGVRFFLDLP